MKKINVATVLIVLLLSFSVNAQVASKKSKSAVKFTSANAKEYALFGDKFETKKVLTNKEMLKQYKSLKKGDSVAVKFRSNIKDVCKKKGCWMQMDLTENKESFVRFKDYGFFVPLNADNSEAIVNGIAYIDVVTVDELRHYAKDGGKSQAEINKITKPEVTYAFQASGVLIKK